jgi:hypothetical protein
MARARTAPLPVLPGISSSWLKLALRRKDLMARPPVADWQVVEAVDSQALSLLKGV